MARENSWVYRLLPLGKGESSNGKHILATIVDAAGGKNFWGDLLLKSPNDIHVGSDGEGLL